MGYLRTIELGKSSLENLQRFTLQLAVGYEMKDYVIVAVLLLFRWQPKHEGKRQ